MEPSELFKVNKKEWLKGLGLAVIGAVSGFVLSWEQAQHIPTTLVEFKPVLFAVVFAAVPYLAHTWLSNSNADLLTAEVKKVVEPLVDKK